MFIAFGSAAAGGSGGFLRVPLKAAAALCGLVWVAWLSATPVPAAQTDPAVKFMAQVGRELMAAARTRSPSVIANVFQRYADVSYIGMYSLGTYRNLLPASERSNFLGGMVRFIGRYAATESQKYVVTKVEWSDESIRGTNGIMVDSKITLADGSSYDVRWLLARYGNSYRVRDAMVGPIWVTPLLKGLFEDYIAQNGGHPRALVAVLNR
jgi:phospholipid transport system substrate-binding protein